MARTPNISTSSFKPLDINEIMMVPLAKQKMEDDLLETSAQMAEMQADTLDADAEQASKILNDYKTRISNLSDDVINRGVSREHFNKLRGLRGEIKREYSEGFLGKAIANKKAASEYINKLATEKERQAGWSPKEAQQWAMHHVSQFGGTSDGLGGFNSFVGKELAQRVDEDEFIKDAVDSVQGDVSDVAMHQFRVNGLSGVQQAYREGSIDSRSFNKIMEAVLTKSATSPQLLSSLQQQAFFTGEENPLDIGSFQYETTPKLDRSGQPILAEDGSPITQTKRVFKAGDSRYGRKIVGASRAGAYIKENLSYKVIEDPIAKKMLLDGMNQSALDILVGFNKGEMNKVTPASLDSVREDLALYGQEIDTIKSRRDAKYKELKAQGLSDGQIKDNFGYRLLNDQYVKANTEYKNSDARMKNLYKNVDDQLSSDDKKILDLSNMYDKYGSATEALKREFDIDIADYKVNFGQDPEWMAGKMLMQKLGVDMGGGRSRGGVDVARSVIKNMQERRAGLTEQYLDAHPRAEYFTRLNSLATGKESTFLGAWNKNASDNFSVAGSTLAYHGGSLEENDDYQALMVEGEVPQIQVEMTDGIDDGGNSFNNVIVTTSAGSMSFQVIDNLNAGAKMKVANNLKRGDFQQRKMGEKMEAEAKYLPAIKRAGVTWQDESTMSIQTPGGKRIDNVKITKDPENGYYTVKILGVNIELDGRPYLKGETEIALAINQEMPEISRILDANNE